MMNVAREKRRRDWSLILLILPLGVAMMMCVGQQAIRMSPNWSVDGDMKSALDPESAPKQNALIIPPISNDILTPVTWWDTFLTPSDTSGGGVVVFPPFITFEPSATPSVTASVSATPPTSTITATPLVTGTTPPPPTSTPTKKPTDTPAPTTCTDPAATNNGGPLPCTYPPTTCTDPAATNNGGPLPCTYPPTTCTDPLANNSGGPLPCTYTPTTCTDPLANNNGGPLPCIYPITSTPYGTQTAIPPQTTIGTPDGNVGAGIPNGSYIVLTLTVTPIVVTNPSETNYDMVYYERPTGGGVDFDSVIISISMDGTIYYVVFNWGDNQPNDHTNVDVNDLPPPPPGCTDLECDNQHIDDSDLYDPNGGGTSTDTGILIDVDNAPSNPPPGDYWYIAVEAPNGHPGDTGDGADVDAIEIVDIAPTP